MEIPRIKPDDIIKVLSSEKRLGKATAWCRWVLSDPKNFDTFCYVVFPHAFTEKFTKMHLDTVEYFNRPESGAAALPRGFGKSTTIGLGYVTWLIVYRLEWYIPYMSMNHQKSVAFLEPLRSEFKSNIMLKLLYPSAMKKTKNVKDEEGRDREDCIDINGIRVEALSFEKDIRGLRHGTRRPTLIILDDVETRERVMNPELRAKDEFKLNADIIPALDPKHGRIKFIGTILHPQSLLRKKLLQYGGPIYRAEDTHGNPTWPERFTKEKLASIRRDIKDLAYAQEYLNEPMASGISIIRREWLLAACDHELSMFEPDRFKYDFKVLGVDFAFSERITADSSHFGSLARWYNEEAETIYDVTQLIWKQGMSATEQFDLIEYYVGQYGYDDAALEENSIRSMSAELRKRYSFPHTLFWTAANDPKAPKPTQVDYDGSPMKRHTVGKAQLIERLASAFQNGSIRLPYKTDADKDATNRFIDECLTFAYDDGRLVETGVHADAPIAIGYALERCEMAKFVPAFAISDMSADEPRWDDE